MMPNILGGIGFRLSKPEEEIQGAILIDVGRNKVAVILNRDRKFRVLENKDLIVAGLNKELNRLAQHEFEKLADAEEGLEKSK